MEYPGFQQRWAERAIAIAQMSTCAKSKRGAIMAHPDTHTIFEAFNGPPRTFECTRDTECWSSCNRVAVHAEERLLLTPGARAYAPGSHIVHARVNSETGDLLPSGCPSCWQCSRMIVECEVGWVWLYHDDGEWTPYQAAAFHELTLKFKNLPVRRSL